MRNLPPMPKIVDITVSPEDLHAHPTHIRLIAKRLGVPPQAITGVELLRRSIDARKRPCLDQ
jgi:hypothetical protein